DYYCQVWDNSDYYIF
nr:immunoglobulin light chain junction region [Macaca mulatta]MOW15394.1 immunoglobulin light chain junction region [Macaca mulatta]MOW15874.1 immunoglobulin light chain junction region [Macaca mulatta]MOW17486.1 immunoglobulin light chain junction region [Macaca mulatta]MOW18128.1 immunoglobulin light chain junction region [Macaca mulatta]